MNFLFFSSSFKLVFLYSSTIFNVAFTFACFVSIVAFISASNLSWSSTFAVVISHFSWVNLVYSSKCVTSSSKVSSLSLSSLNLLLNSSFWSPCCSSFWISSLIDGFLSLCNLAINLFWLVSYFSINRLPKSSFCSSVSFLSFSSSCFFSSRVSLASWRIWILTSKC